MQQITTILNYLKTKYYSQTFGKRTGNSTTLQNLRIIKITYKLNHCL